MSFSTSILILILLFFIIIVINYIKSKPKNSINFSQNNGKPHVFCKRYNLKKENVEKVGYIIYVNCFDERLGIFVDNDKSICSKEIISYDGLIIEEVSNFC